MKAWINTSWHYSLNKTMDKPTTQQKNKNLSDTSVLTKEKWISEINAEQCKRWTNELCSGVVISQCPVTPGLWHAAYTGSDTPFYSNSDINKVIEACYDECSAMQHDVEEGLGVVSEAKARGKTPEFTKLEQDATDLFVQFIDANGNAIASEIENMHRLDNLSEFIDNCRKITSPNDTLLNNALNELWKVGSEFDIDADKFDSALTRVVSYLPGNPDLSGTDDIKENELVGDKAVIDALIKAGYPSYSTIKGGGADLINTAYIMGKVTANDELKGYEICIDSIEDDAYSVYALNRKDPAGWIFVEFTHGVEDRPEHAVSIGERIIKNGITAEPIKSITQGDEQLKKVPAIMDSASKTNISEAPKFETHIRYLSYIQRRDGKEFPDNTWDGVVGTVVQAGRMRDDRHIFYRPIGSDEKFTLFFDIDEIEEADNPPSLADVQRIKRQKHLADLAAAARKQVNEQPSLIATKKSSLCEHINRRLGLAK
jgi:hypothetical protein